MVDAANITVLDLPSCTTYLPPHAILITPEDLAESLIGVYQLVSVLPFKSEGQHPQWLTRLIPIHLRYGLWFCQRRTYRWQLLTICSAVLRGWM